MSATLKQDLLILAGHDATAAADACDDPKDFTFFADSGWRDFERMHGFHLQRVEEWTIFTAWNATFWQRLRSTWITTDLQEIA